MIEIQPGGTSYTTLKKEPVLLARLFPSLHFYSRFIGIVFASAAIAKRGEYDAVKWKESSDSVLKYLEDIGAHIQVTGLEHLREIDEPCVIIGNHMSFLETLLLPGLILPKPVTFVVKQSLIEYPVFKHILLSRNPIAVKRQNARQDLKIVLSEGVKRLQDGVSVIVFPQSTRSHTFDPAKMNSIGVKLAKKANVPIIPLALKTDALQNGTLLKDFGAIDCSKPIRFAFDAPIRIVGKGTEETLHINQFIGRKLQEWQRDMVAGS